MLLILLLIFNNPGFRFLKEKLPVETNSLKIIDVINQQDLIDGKSNIITTESERIEREWRADPSDGLRPLIKTRKKINEDTNKN